ncbi:hypothetical protein [Kroppenstedtia guangzhouensis]|uniref:hypothetical protein n=1 Tax=Kroppenstedtia guangzhouensis TaxID=1274356 RepID=UPI00166F03F2|nr:hypothetical protein [Kroppenstedtia guangzhouensis]
MNGIIPAPARVGGEPWEVLDGSEGFAILQEGSPSPDEILRIGHGLVVRDTPPPVGKGGGTNRGC